MIGPVLSVEDDPAEAQALAELLAWGCRAAVVAPDLRTARLRLAALRPAVIVLDLNPPNEEGLAWLRELRAKAFGWQWTILVVSGQSDTEQIAEALLTGADDYVTKSCAPQELLARIAVAERLAALRAGFRRLSAFRPDLPSGGRLPSAGILVLLPPPSTDPETLAPLWARWGAPRATGPRDPGAPPRWRSTCPFPGGGQCPARLAGIDNGSPAGPGRRAMVGGRPRRRGDLRLGGEPRPGRRPRPRVGHPRGRAAGVSGATGRPADHRGRSQHLARPTLGMALAPCRLPPRPPGPGPG